MKGVKFIGPTKLMKDSLEKIGLHITWPKTINSEEDLAIEGQFFTELGNEKIVLIDLRYGEFSFNAEVDKAVFDQLNAAHEDYDIDNEMETYLSIPKQRREEMGVPSARVLHKDLQDEETCLERFANVSGWVANGCKGKCPFLGIDGKKSVDETPITIPSNMAKDLLAVLEGKRISKETKDKLKDTIKRMLEERGY